MDALGSARPLSDLPGPACRELLAIVSDIDGTLTTESKIPASAFEALWRVHAAGLRLVLVTGGPAGGADHIARTWPVDGVVAESGAFYFRHVDGKLRRRFMQPEAERRANRDRLQVVAKEILDAVPGAALASDQAYRECDLAIDYAADVPRLPDEAVDRILAIFGKHGCCAAVSSIHVNGWYGEYGKLGTLRTLFDEELGIDLDRELSRVLFVGDAPNDEPLFRFFPLSVGVANIADLRARISHPPAYVSTRRGGAGFAEIVDTVLSRRHD